MKKIRIFYLKIFIFLGVVKFSVYLNRHVFIMQSWQAILWVVKDPKCLRQTANTLIYTAHMHRLIRVCWELMQSCRQCCVLAHFFCFFFSSCCRHSLDASQQDASNEFPQNFNSSHAEPR